MTEAWWPTRCSSCGASIVWARTETGKAIPLDPEPREVGGNLVIDDEGIARVSKPDLFDKRPRYVSHFATCPNADSHRRKR